eukprot:Hpha_TRINITY_DN13943_c3_g1::TRINITY_DN13943_c3_g1_i1::g.35259::m.35259
MDSDAVTGGDAKRNLLRRLQQQREHQALQAVLAKQKAANTTPAIPPTPGFESGKLIYNEGTSVLYRTTDGTQRPATVTRVDRTIQPESYFVKFTDSQGGERCTEGPRLSLQPGAKIMPLGPSPRTPPPTPPSPPPAAIPTAVPVAAPAAPRGAGIAETLRNAGFNMEVVGNLGTSKAQANERKKKEEAERAAAEVMRAQAMLGEEQPERKYCAYFMKGEKCPLGPACRLAHALAAPVTPKPAGGFSIGKSSESTLKPSGLSEQVIARVAVAQAMSKTPGRQEEDVPGKPRSLSQLLQAGQKAEEQRREQAAREKALREKQIREKENWYCTPCNVWVPNTDDKCPGCSAMSPLTLRCWRCDACGNYNGRSRDACNGKRAHRCSLDHDCKICNSGDLCGKSAPEAKRKRVEKEKEKAIELAASGGVIGGAWGGTKKNGDSAGQKLKVSPNPVPKPLPVMHIKGTVKQWDQEGCRGFILPDDFGAEVYADRKSFSSGSTAPSSHLLPGKKVRFIVTEVEGQALVARDVSGEGLGGVGPLERVQGWWMRPGGKTACSVRPDGEVMWKETSKGSTKLALDTATQQVMLSDWCLIKEEHTKAIRKLHWVKTDGEQRVWHGHPWPRLEIPDTAPTVETPAPWAKCTNRLVFLMLGAGNMAGRASSANVAQAPQCQRTWVFNEVGEWGPGMEPVGPFDGSGVGMGPGVSFARRLTEGLPAAGIFLVPCASESTGVMDWQEGTPLFEAAVQRARLAARSCDGALAGVLWAQGEADATPETWPAAGGYTEPLRRVMISLRKRLAAPALPFVAASLGIYLERCDDLPPTRRPTMWRLVNTALQNATGKGVSTAGFSVAIPSEGLTAEGMYLDAAGQRELGRRMAEGWVQLCQTGGTDTEGYKQGRGGQGGQDESVPMLVQPPPIPMKVPVPVSASSAAASGVIAAVASSDLPTGPAVTAPTVPTPPAAPAPPA